ncbi:MAG TPA: tRNA (adenosine(37)-N6)-threonylcarbamoyltransferase complex ATPase subunit type 1 TsaE [Candidatus Latescibacteria bacterium]|nr:tRNA (adenosine(37)-N6)-threonylcarbamoyltransferase complex ATPase subunit type 1 TsaE [Candidatus Latescibacterota bacterium]HOF60161.1 tRNA (adenosine(37)-N6)-threonylcarbamoyltransferase complex ATPase subunit type 1 TsaE [Candidatus Latescibacterota bacterium]HOS63444.1 tRNA (adenosine(37)-N6)-threonylcarbamoyltransferase complex ATPase subunit type 1 TsaE [Candidatus Latescibacterota bacterium]HPK73193.1 tRNA (adenosine(37)-N6)-threonylcarbamoyltransferase complex ATPase subunit type 1 
MLIDPEPRTYVTTSPDETREFGKRIAPWLRPGSVVFLYGDLGSGKTTLVQGICAGLEVGVWPNSPTFTLINQYEGTVPVFHCDFYRLADPGELATLGLEEVFFGDGIALVEWPELAEEWAPSHTIRLTITRRSAKKREIVLRGLSL